VIANSRIGDARLAVLFGWRNLQVCVPPVLGFADRKVCASPMLRYL
jgi:hypothetical protein